MDPAVIRETEHEATELSQDEPIYEFSNDGVDLSLIRWFLSLSPFERLQAAQDMIDTAWMLRDSK